MRPNSAAPLAKGLTAFVALLVTGKFLLPVVFALLLIGVALCNPTRTGSEAVYIRNHTPLPLLLTLTVPRRTLRLDTVWQQEERVVDSSYVLHLSEVFSPGLRYPTPVLPALISEPGDPFFPQLLATPASGVAPLPPPWFAQHFPLFTPQVRLVRIDSLSAPADSVQLTFPLAPDSCFQVAYSRTVFSGPEVV